MTTRYNPAWQHVYFSRPPNEIERAVTFYRFYAREYIFPDGWTPVVREMWYNPIDRIAAVFEYAPEVL